MITYIKYPINEPKSFYSLYHLKAIIASQTWLAIIVAPVQLTYFSYAKDKALRPFFPT